MTPVGVEAVVKNLQGFQSGLNVMQGAITGIATAVTQFAIGAAVKMGKAVYDLGKQSVMAAVDFEDGFSGVRKTVDTTEEEFQKLQDSFRELSKTTPINIADINKIGELGGQLGVVNADTEDVTATMTEFTRVIAAMGVSTNLSVESAATDLARFANVMGTTAEYGDETYSRLGSTIVALGNNFATTESDISNFGSRIAGAGKIAGLTEANVFAIGAAMSSVGIQAESGGTAVQKTLLAMNEAVISGGDQLEIFAGTAGMTTEDFATLWEEDAGAGFQSFVEGLGLMGDDAIGVLDALGLKDQRLIRSFLSLSNAGGLLGETMDLANVAFEENTALMDEAEKKYATTKSQITMMKNTFNDLGISIGNAVLPMLNDLLVQAKPFIDQVGGWLENNLPAIIANVAGFVQGTLVPAFTVMWNWLGENIPVAIEKLSAFWNSTLLPAFIQAQAFIVGTLVPAFNNLVAFFQTEGPGAIDTLGAAFDDVWSFIQGISQTFVTWFTDNLPLIIKTGQTLIDFWTNILAPALSGAWEIIKGVVKIAMDNIMSSITLIMQIINGDWAGAWETIKQMAINTWDTIKETVVNFIASIQPIIDSYVTWWLEKWNEGLNRVKEIISGVWESIKTSVTEFLDGIKATMSSKMEETNTFWSDMWESIRQKASDAVQAVKNFIETTLQNLFASMGLDLDTMRARWSAIWDDVLLIGQELWNRISTAITTRLTLLSAALAVIWQEVSTMISDVWTVISTFLSETWDTISTFVNEKAAAIRDFLAPIWDAISTKVSEIWGAIVLAVTKKVKELYDAVIDKIEEIKMWFG